MAHITGGGIKGNFKRIIPDKLYAQIDLSKLQIPEIFHLIKKEGKIPDEEMLSTFNCGAGLLMAVRKDSAARICRRISERILCYEIGTIKAGEEKEKVQFIHHLQW